MGSGISIMTEGSWLTPLGEVSINEKLGDYLCRDIIDKDDNAHMYEHSIEVQLPFLQFTAGSKNFNFVPICMTMQDYETSEKVGEIIADAIKKTKERVAIIASTDFSHAGFNYMSMPPEGMRVDEYTEKQDKLAIDKILQMDPEGLIETVQKNNITMCGYGPVAAMLRAIKLLGANKVELLKYGTSYEVHPGVDGWDPILMYTYPQFWANVSGTIYDLTYFSYDPFYPWAPMYREDLPFSAVANGTIQIPELIHTDWTVAYGHTDPNTREFVVEGWLEVVSGVYDTFESNRITEYNITGDYNYIELASGGFMNYTQNVRAYFFNITLANGTYFYTLEPHFYTIDQWNESKQVYEVLYHAFIDLNGTEIRLYTLPEYTFTQVNSVIVDDIFNPNFYEWDGKWYDIHQVEWRTFFTVNNATHMWEVVDIWEDWKMKFNIPSFEFTLDGGTTWYHVEGAREMIYRAHWAHGFSTKIDYMPLPVTVMSSQDRIIVGAPRYGMWDFDTWTVNPSTGALDLDGDLGTTIDQFYVQKFYQSTNIFNVTEEYLWVNILWEPNSTLYEDEFHLNSYTGMVTFNRTNSWNDTFIWYYADSFEPVSSGDMALIQDLLFDSNGHPAPGYWGISWMGRNFTSTDLATKAEEEGWDWFETSQEWSWIWWELQESYSAEVNNGTHTNVPMDINLAYQFAGMLAWNDTEDEGIRVTAGKIKDFTTQPGADRPADAHSGKHKPGYSTKIFA